jgi:hypothetical protein
MNKITYTVLRKVADGGWLDQYVLQPVERVLDETLNHEVRQTKQIYDNTLRLHHLAEGKVKGSAIGSWLGLIVALKLAKDKSFLEKILYGAGGAMLGAGAGGSIGDLVAEFRNRPIPKGLEELKIG